MTSGLSPIPEQVSAQAATYPDSPAFTNACETVTYRNLEDRSNQLAHVLLALGVPRGAAVGLMMRRSPSAVIGALGILKAGAAYLPFDVNCPADRLAFMLSEAQVRIVVSEAQTAERIPGGPWQTILIDEIPDQSKDSPGLTIPASDLAYVLYTSGSTGQPKGVMVTHGNLSNLVSWHREQFQVTPSDRASQVASFGFDAAVWEVWPYLAAGASVHFADEYARSEPEALRDWLLAQQITVSFVATPVAEYLIGLKWPADTSLRVLLTGADTLRRYPPNGLPFALVNNYGPTECTVVSTSCIVPPRAASTNGDADLPPIGRPISNMQAYILDGRLQLVPDGETGELAIGGAGVARGYLQRPEDTRLKFIPDPFSPNPDAILYRTGDFARYMEDGQIAFSGKTGRPDQDPRLPDRAGRDCGRR